MSCSGDKGQNLEKAIAGIRKAAGNGAQIICLQELSGSLYFCDVEDYENFQLAEPVRGPSTERLATLAAEILVYTTAIGWAGSQSEETNSEQYNAWQTIQRSHAVANGVHVVSVNRVDVEQNGAMKFWGGSFIANPFGKVLYSASHENEE